MPTTLTAQLKTQIIKRLRKQGDLDFADSVETWWRLHLPKQRPGGLERVYLYVLLDAIEDVEGATYTEMDVKEGIVEERRADIFEHLAEMRTQTLDRIKFIEGQSGARATPGIVEFQNKSPLTGDPGTRDPNAREYRGDPVRRRFPWVPR